MEVIIGMAVIAVENMICLAIAVQKCKRDL